MPLTSIPKQRLLSCILDFDPAVIKENGKLQKENRIECGLCFTLPNQTDHHTTTACNHSFCTECFYKYLEFTLHNCNNYFPCLMCPTCNLEISNNFLFNEIKYLPNLDPETDLSLILTNKLIDSEIQHKFKLKKLIIKCSTANCTSLFLPANEKIGHCTSCSKDTCLICENKIHGILNCIQNKKLKSLLGSENDYNSAVYIASNTINCPNCLVRLNRDRGCNHLTCTSCKYEFCWVCLDNWKNHNFETGGFYQCLKRANKVLKIKNIKSSTETTPKETTKENNDKEIWLNSFTMFHDQKKGIKILKEIKNKDLFNTIKSLIVIKNWLKDLYFLLFYFSKRKNKFKTIQDIVVRLEKVCEEPYDLIENYEKINKIKDNKEIIKKIENKLKIEIKYMENHIGKFVK
eukprot:GAHX01002511.1.p1 GENE.GAHX01002511.1~~GAHX01002511.1.p1  ORF type:complete len:404 (-),score=82.75 GAHX01002511.1:64-1275(-)